jgi:hypothetical protein
MPKCNKSNFNHALYNQNRVRRKSGSKIKNIVEHVILLKKKEQAEGQTTRLKMAWLKVHAKMKKTGITQAMVDSAIDSK